MQVPGTVGGLAVAVTDGLGIGIGAAAPAGYPESIVVLRSAATRFFSRARCCDSATRRWPDRNRVKLGVWAYTAVIVRQAAKSRASYQITAA